MIIGLDLGTTSISAVLFDPDTAAVVCSDECPNDFGVVNLPEGYHEQNAADIFEAACGLISSLIRKSGVAAERIEGLALTGQQHGMVVVDSLLNPLTNLITWRDRRTAGA